MATRTKATTRRESAARVAAAMRPSVLVSEALKEDTNVRKVLHEHLAERAQASQHVAQAVNKAFDGWRPTNFTAAERVALNYLWPHEKLAPALRGVVEKGLETLRDDAQKRAFKVRLGANLKSLINSTKADQSSAGKIALGDWIDFLRSRFAMPTLRNEPALTVCEAETKAHARIDTIEKSGSNPPTTAAAGGPETATATVGEPTRTKDLVKEHVHRALAPRSDLQVWCDWKAKMTANLHRRFLRMTIPITAGR
jgi:hypothetical protein